MFDIKQNYGCINIITFEENNFFVEGINLNRHINVINITGV